MSQSADGLPNPSAAHRRDDILHRLSYARAQEAPVPPPPPVSLAEGYRIQDDWAESRIAVGETLLGYKIGLTTITARTGLNAIEPGRGYLFERDVLPSPAVITGGGFPLRYEVELAVRIAEPVSPDDSVEELAGKVEIAPALEVIATRWDPPTNNIGLWAADNAMAQSAVVGTFIPASQALREQILVVDDAGRAHYFASRDAFESLSWLITHLNASGQRLTPGTIVLTGALVGPHPVRAGQSIVATIESVGEVRAEFRSPDY
ncbi:2-keto-4-pentenoate hydratase [Herbiconiux ginsengi]|uniref:2-oxo-hept-3-ene-1,7-dioate hydratase/2-keto-4-pentenoate hydratase n=1 Tax=Herbiconiux ginsengi TaxID=381665 RepID=A0A1H3U2W6_9MICO|nr:fumarylacetoacetate hydrolase family protein [Herbiconiux ginsengi]SDZ56678.1 2-oxo-hept-3-ene-1,7-dioate hydratase/2-keto-4-pentenoate hydratase [Herbiconiux ginsengi]